MSAVARVDYDKECRRLFVEWERADREAQRAKQETGETNYARELDRDRAMKDYLTFKYGEEWPTRLLKRESPHGKLL